MPYNIDQDLQNADWLKTMSWDLPLEPEAFLRAIGGRDQLAHFMTLPAAEAMPDELREELENLSPEPPAPVGPPSALVEPEPPTASPIMVPADALQKTKLPLAHPLSRQSYQTAVSQGLTDLGYEEWFQQQNALLTAAGAEQRAAQPARPARKSHLGGDGSNWIIREEADSGLIYGPQQWQDAVRREHTNLSYEKWQREQIDKWMKRLQPGYIEPPPVRYLWLCELAAPQKKAAEKPYRHEAVYVERETPRAYYGRGEKHAQPWGPIKEWSKSQWMIDDHVPGGTDANVTSVETMEPIQALSKEAWQHDVEVGTTDLGYTAWMQNELNEVGELLMQFEAEEREKEKEKG